MKTFRAFNFIHIVVTLTLFSLTIYYNPVSSSKPGAIAAIILLPSIILINCTSNINLVIKYLNNESLGRGRKIIFWIFFILFIILTAIFTLLIYSSFTSWIEFYKKGYNTPFTFVARIASLVIMVCNGIYICIYQFYFFYLFKKNKKSILESIVNEIGEPENI